MKPQRSTGKYSVIVPRDKWLPLILFVEANLSEYHQIESLRLQGPTFSHDHEHVADIH